MSLTIFSSNKLENLSEALARILANPPSDPLASEIIVVQSRGMQRWLSLQTARKLGICANVSFPFPNTFVNEIVESVWPDLCGSPGTQASDLSQVRDEHLTYSPLILTWEIMKLLPACLVDDAFHQLKRYLSGPGTTLKRLQLSMRIADLFDQYLLFRPEMVLRWEAGNDKQWQAKLWRRIVENKQGLHRAALGHKLLALLRTAEKIEFLPERINVFGISALPEFHVRIFSALARVRDVNLFLLNPCREYWGDIRSKREIDKIVDKAGQFEMDLSGPQVAEALHIETGNSLLASMGKLGRDFFDLLQDDIDCQTVDLFQPPAGETLLCSIQKDILELREPVEENGTKEKIPVDDKSLQLHCCHSPRREIEVLHDQILDMFQANPDLKPADILVMAPDIEPYAPFIQAVFDLPFADPHRVPFSIADRTFRHENKVIAAFFSILQLHRSRLGASEVMSLLEEPAVLENFSISPDDLESIRHWVDNARIRWGMNAGHLQRLNLPAHDENTWQAGIERLLLGYALPGNNDKVFESILPYDNVEGHQAEVLGNFIEFTDQLFKTIEHLTSKRTLAEWRDELNELLDRFFSERDDVTARQIQILRNEINLLVRCQELTEFDESIELQVVQHYLESRLNKQGHGFGFLAGSVTFCSMLPMRSIPVKMLCLIGMNTNAFPVSARRLSFDLLAQKPRKGDRSRRHDDRYLFLEALLSARQRLYISYVGRNIKDNSEIPPSVLVSELLEYVETNYSLTDAGTLPDFLTTIHRLQAFSPAYFQTPDGAKIDRHFSYSQENRQAAESLLALDREAPAFCKGPIPGPDLDFLEITLADLYRFLRNPVEYFFSRRLAIRLKAKEPGLTDTESFRFGGLEQYGAANDLLARKLAAENVTDFREARIHSGALPHGGIGEVVYETLNKNVSQFADQLRPYVEAKSLPALDIELKLSGMQLTGVVEGIYEKGAVIYRLARVKAKDHLLAWINHLAMSCAQRSDYPTRTHLFGVNNASESLWQGWTFEQVESPEEDLATLLDLYKQGLCRPLRFFPDSALVFCRALQSAGGPKKGPAWEQANKEFRGSERTYFCEHDDPYIYRSFGQEENPLNAEFEELAQSVFAPLLNCQKELR